MSTNAWDQISLAQLTEFSRRDDCLDAMVPSDLRHIVGRYAEAVTALTIFLDEFDNTYDGEPMSMEMSQFIDRARAVVAKAEA